MTNPLRYPPLLFPCALALGYVGGALADVLPAVGWLLWPALCVSLVCAAVLVAACALSSTKEGAL